MKKLVYICSACRGDYENNLQNARIYCRAIMKRFPDVVAIAPHLLFTQFLDDSDPAERAHGLEAGIALLDMCDEMWVFGLDKPTEGMSAEIEYAKEYGIPIRDGFKTCESTELPEEEKLGNVLIVIPEEYTREDPPGYLTMKLYGDVVVELAKALRHGRGSTFKLEVE